MGTRQPCEWERGRCERERGLALIAEHRPGARPRDMWIDCQDGDESGSGRARCKTVLHATDYERIMKGGEGGWGGGGGRRRGLVAKAGALMRSWLGR